MLLQYDRTGFPLLCLPECGLKTHLLPVTKIQMESFLSEPNAFGDTWYEQVLELNPRIAAHRLNAHNRENLFVTGIQADEALAFAAWMGGGFDLPTVQEWQQIHQGLQDADLYLPSLKDQLSDSLDEPARTLLLKLLDQLRPSSWLELSLMTQGVVEWVRMEKTSPAVWNGLGAPRSEFYPNAFNPPWETIRPLAHAHRIRYFGFRLVQRG